MKQLSLRKKRTKSSPFWIWNKNYQIEENSYWFLIQILRFSIINKYSTFYDRMNRIFARKHIPVTLVIKAERTRQNNNSQVLIIDNRSIVSCLEYHYTICRLLFNHINSFLSTWETDYGITQIHKWMKYVFVNPVVVMYRND